MRLFACVFLLGTAISAQTPASLQSILLELKDPSASGSALSDQLVDEMIGLSGKEIYRPSRTTVQRFSEDFTSALLGKDVTPIRAKALQVAILCVLSGQGSTFVAANTLRDTLTSCGIEHRTVKAIVDRFSDIGREVRGPDDLSRTLVRLK
jgi:hypothetical protein